MDAIRLCCCLVLLVFIEVHAIPDCTDSENKGLSTVFHAISDWGYKALKQRKSNRKQYIVATVMSCAEIEVGSYHCK